MKDSSEWTRKGSRKSESKSQTDQYHGGEKSTLQKRHQSQIVFQETSINLNWLCFLNCSRAEKG